MEIKNFKKPHLSVGILLTQSYYIIGRWLTVQG